ncbi:Methyltransferase domain-containing protein [Actinacidiphila rubida]|uniref:Methyltransferase domain-containing protein n=2 Tax=Actinacidiphila rubida TaxID=310780 RepID=A0A1H8H096_9ACTN|nr:class I SAM-dependent methyltransferase [Actinacidiphila rubida]SEN49656.1 Methyltransferase domain-containing protein [Actinacidiphila rubida]
MSSLLKNPLARRMLRPAANLVDNRVQRPVSRLRRDLDSAARAEREASRKDRDALRGEIEALRGELGSLQREMADVRGAQYAVGLLFDRTGRTGHRVPTPADIDRLVAEISEVTGQDGAVARRNVTIAFRNVVALETLALGRLAGTTANVCGKLATVPLLAPADPEVLEIGTLYGLFAATLMRMLHRAGQEPRLTIVDPLAGSQLQPGATVGGDPTGTPVRMDVLRANLVYGGRAGEEARVKQGLSGDQDVRAAVSDRKYGVIVIDGDHSADGVAADLEWAEEIAAPGAVIVLDDYGDKAWQGVQEAADRHLAAGGTRFEMIGRVATSAYLRAR